MFLLVKFVKLNIDSVAKLSFMASQELPGTAILSRSNFRYKHKMLKPRYSGLTSQRVNLSPFTKDFREVGHCNESLVISCICRHVLQFYRKMS